MLMVFLYSLRVVVRSGFRCLKRKDLDGAIYYWSFIPIRIRAKVRRHEPLWWGRNP